jgi:NADPH:quinone reductase-like Zn-dependent oxidoreductase
MAPSTMKALKVVSAGKAEVQEVPVPKLRDDYVLVKVNAVALNPTDWYAYLQLLQCSKSD